MKEEQYFSEAVELIKEGEGYREKVYKCTAGHDTIGYGTKLPLDKPWEQQVCDGESNPSHINHFNAIALLRIRLRGMLYELVDRLDNERKLNFNQLPNKVKAVLLDMVYNLGVNGLLGFKRMWRAVKDGDWNQMAAEMADSRWYNQVGVRGERNVGLILEHAKE